MKIARKIRDEKGICFGNYEDGADVGGRWFKEIIDQGYRFTDPLPREEQKNDYYLHCWQGHAGHDVVTGKVEYRRGYIKERLLEDFGYEI